MATVNLCDKCGTMAKSPAMGTLVIVPVNDEASDVYSDAVRTTDRNVHRKEVCPGCVGELMTWLNTPTTADRPRAYNEPWTPDADPGVLTDSATLFRLALEASKKEAGLTE